VQICWYTPKTGEVESCSRLQVSTYDAQHFVTQSWFPFQTKFLLTIRIFLFGCLIVSSPVFLFCLLTWLCFIFSLEALFSVSLRSLLQFILRWLPPERDGISCLRRSLIWWSTIVNNFICTSVIWPLLFDPWPLNYVLHFRRQKIQILKVFLFICCIHM